MKVYIKDLLAITETIFNDAIRSGVTSFILDEDYYWSIDSMDLYKKENTDCSNNMTLGSLYFEYERLKSEYDEEDSYFVTYAITWVAEFFKFFSIKFPSWDTKWQSNQLMVDNPKRKKIPMEEFFAIPKRMFNQALEEGFEYFYLDEDDYWVMSDTSLYDIFVTRDDKPNDLTLGSLYKDYELLIADYENNTLGPKSLKYLSSLCMYIGYTFSSWSMDEVEEYEDE